MVDASSGVDNCCSVVLLFISFVFVCISLTHSDSSIVYDACGHTLRDVMMADLLVPVCCSIISCLVSEAMHYCDFQLYNITGIVFLVCGAVCMLCLGSVTVDESIKALSIPNCVLAMSSTEGGINSPSANTGSPLLAVMGFFVGVPYIIMSIVVFILLIMLLITFILTQKDPSSDFIKQLKKHNYPCQVPSALPIVSLVFLCIALTHSNSEMVSAACGVTLRNVLIAITVTPILLLILYLIVASIFIQFYGGHITTARTIALSVYVGLFILSMLFLSSLTVSESVNALYNPNCTSAMSSKEGGINSPSANTGSPLLAIMGLFIGIPYLVATVLSMLVIIIRSCIWWYNGESVIEKIKNGIMK